jgi:hypothetical protein
LNAKINCEEAGFTLIRWRLATEPKDSWFNLVNFILCLMVVHQAALAAPPLICDPFEISRAPSDEPDQSLGTSILITDWK